MENPDKIKEVAEMEAIERYLQGNMSGKELIDFEDRLAKDPTFAQEVNLFMDLIQSIDLNGDEELKASISNVHKSLEKDNFFEQSSSISQSDVSIVNSESKVVRKRAKFRRALSIAAGVVFLIGGTFFMFKQSTNIASKEQFTKVFKPETKNLNVILDRLEGYGLADTNIPRKKGLANALYLYEKGDYEQAQKDLTKHVSKYKEDNVGKFYLGLCYLHRGSYAEAATQFQSLIQDENFDLYNESRWYLSLSYMMLDSMNGKKDAKDLLEQILLDPKAPHKEEAQYILEHLNK